MEVLGAVASGIAVGEAAKVVFKIKWLWSEMEDIPDRIRSLLDYLDALGPLLEQIESEFTQSTIPDETRSSASLGRSIAVCQRAMATLHGLAFDMEKELGQTKALKKRLVCAKVALKKDVVQRLERKLEMAINLFNVSMTHYNMAMQHVTYKAVQTLVQNVHVVVGSEQDQEHVSQLQGLAFVRKGCRSTHLRSKTYSPTFFGRIWVECAPDGSCRHWFFQPPSWLTMKIWEAELRTACSGWQTFASIRCYNIRPANARVFKCIQEGRIDDLFTLFETKEASPFDRDEYGRSLIHYATIGNSLRACRTLLTFGLDICLDERQEEIVPLQNRADGSLLTPRELVGLWHHSIYESEKSPEYLQEKIAIMDLFHQVEYYHYSPSDTVQLLSSGLTQWGKWKADVLAHFQRRFAPTYYQLPLKTRLESVRKTVQMRGKFTESDYPDLLRILLKEDRTITPEDILVSIREGVSLVHTTAMGFAASRTAGLPWGRSYETNEKAREAEWNRFAKDVMEAANVEALNTVETVSPLDGYVADQPEAGDDRTQWTGTPLLSLLHVASGKLEAGLGWREHFGACVNTWLELLKSCDFDLEQYGKREEQLYRQLVSAPSQRLRRVVCDADRLWMGDPNSTMLVVELVGFEYGPLPEDWLLTWRVEPLPKGVYSLSSESVPAVTESQHQRRNTSVDTAIILDNMRIPGGWVD